MIRFYIGDLFYTVEKETKENIFFVDTYQGHKMRYSKKTEAMQFFKSSRWFEIESLENVPYDLRDMEEEVVESLSGNEIIERFAEIFNLPIKYTKKNEPWISLDDELYTSVTMDLLTKPEFSTLKWQTRRGKKSSVVVDESTGMTLVLKVNKYIWCTNNGSPEEA